MTRRMARVNGLLRDELGQVILREIRDPRVALLTTITEVTTSPDLQQAQVFVSVMASPEEQRDTLEGLQAAAGFIRRALYGRLKIRRVPDLVFRLDSSLQEGDDMLRLIDRVTAGPTAAGEPS